MRISDWSSDVCSSDLCHVCPHTVTFCSGLARRQYCFHIAINTNCNHAVSTTMVPNRGGCRMATALAYKQTHTERRIETRTPDLADMVEAIGREEFGHQQIGRAAWRERQWQ